MNPNKKDFAPLDDSELSKVAGGFGEGGIISSGSFASNTGTQLNIVVNWTSAANLSGQHELLVEVGANSSNLTAASFGNGVILTVNGMSYPATNNPISYSGGGMVYNTLASFLIPDVSGTVTLTAVWRFNGTYSGVSLGEITASAVINV